jgi:hypothetical protein
MSKPKDAGSAAGDRADPLVDIIGERIPCRDAKHRVWQALDLLRSCRSNPRVTDGTTTSDLRQGSRPRAL